VSGATVAALVGSLAMGLDRGRGLVRASLLGMSGGLLSVVLSLVIENGPFFDYGLGSFFVLVRIVASAIAGGVSGPIGAGVGMAVSAVRPARRAVPGGGADAR
jgi:hypothetical protein